jgi:hypothetical protein
MAPIRGVVALMLTRTAAAATLRAGGLSNPVLETPDLTAYDPTEVLCTRHKAGGTPVIQGWCRDWLACIKTGAQPAGTAAAVRSAWKPADCREVCGTWPVMSQPEGTAALLAAGSHKGIRGSLAAEAKLFDARANSTRKDCQTSCSKFQTSLTECVAMILFEPGKVAAMGIPETNKPAAPAHCTSKHTGCMPDLRVQYQKCMSKSSNPAHACKSLKTSVEDCKDCPQLEETYMSHYHSFVGGCMDQLNAYWQATHPSAQEVALPGAAGCTVH